nr:site-2 protease family protein [Planctomycetota bacterium]
MTDNETKAQQDSTEQTEQQTPHKNESRHLFTALLILAILVFWGIQNPATALRIALVLLGFGGIVMIHELGHFIVAKLGGIKVEAFSIGMPPVILGIRKLKKGWRIRLLPKPDAVESVEEGDNDTEYQVGLFPIGGFVKMLGQSDTGAAGADDDPRSYANRPIWIRICVVSAGVIFNAIGAVVLFVILFMNGIKLPPAVIGHVMQNSPAYDAGIRPGDEIIEVSGDRFVDFAAVQLSPALSSPGEPISYVVRHPDGTEENIEVIAEVIAGDTSELRYSGIKQAGTLQIDPWIAKDPNAVMVLF